MTTYVADALTTWMASDPPGSGSPLLPLHVYAGSVTSYSLNQKIRAWEHLGFFFLFSLASLLFIAVICRYEGGFVLLYTMVVRFVKVMVSC
jgi:hypothetical protein